MIFSVAYRYRKSMSIIERVFYIYIYIHTLYRYIYRVLGSIYSLSLPLLFIEIYRVGDNRRTVNKSTSPYISDQLGTENVPETVMLIYRSAMSSGLQKYVSI